MKKLFSIALVVGMLFSMTAFAEMLDRDEGVVDLLGDANRDGVVQVVDVQCMILSALAFAIDDPVPACAGNDTFEDLDFTCDGSVDIVDILLVIDATAGEPLSIYMDANENGEVDACEMER